MLSFKDRPPRDEAVTAYDEQQFANYIRLLMAAEEGVDWREAVSVIFRLDPAENPTHAKIVHDSHLARARWMSETGYLQLLEAPTP